MTNSDKKTVIVVEDDEDSRAVLCMILETLGYETVEFPNGQGVAKYLEREPADVVFLDIMMPEVDGYEVLEKIRETKSICETPVFMITAKTSDEDVISGYKSGADYYISKPYSSRQIEYGLKLFLENKNKPIATENQE